MIKKLKIIFVTGMIVIVMFILVGIFSNSLVSLALCKKFGDKIARIHHGEPGFKNYFCYTPSGFDGKSCDKRTDCGSAFGCMLVDENKTTGKGICEDIMSFGCNNWIDENGNVDPMLCAD